MKKNNILKLRLYQFLSGLLGIYLIILIFKQGYSFGQWLKEVLQS